MNISEFDVGDKIEDTADGQVIEILWKDKKTVKFKVIKAGSSNTGCNIVGGTYEKESYGYCWKLLEKKTKNFSRGDKVKVIKDSYNKGILGQYAIVIGKHKDDGYFAIQFLTNINGHFCGNLFKFIPGLNERSCWNVTLDEIEFVEKTEWSEEYTTTKNSPSIKDVETKTENTIKEKGNKMFENLFNKNKELAIQEGQRQAGKVVFEYLFDLPIIQSLPEAIKTFLKTPIGKFILANLLTTLASFYTGGQKDKIEFITDSLMRGALSDLGDSFNINKIFGDLISKISNILPGEKE